MNDLKAKPIPEVEVHFMQIIAKGIEEIIQAIAKENENKINIPIETIKTTADKMLLNLNAVRKGLFQQKKSPLILPGKQ